MDNYENKKEKKYIYIIRRQNPFIKKEKGIDKITCTNFYCQLIEIKNHKPNNINICCEVFQDFESASEQS